MGGARMHTATVAHRQCAVDDLGPLSRSLPLSNHNTERR